MEIANDHLAGSATACGGLGQWLLDRSRHYLRDGGRRSRGSVAQSRYLNSVSARGVPTWREVGRGPMRRDREDELDLADIGGEADTTTHVLNIAAHEEAPNTLDRLKRAEHGIV